MESRGTQILLVEDSWDDMTLLRCMFARMNQPDWQLVETQTLDEALDCVKLLSRGQTAPINPDLVLLDLHLPDSRGLETLKRFRSAALDVPVVVLTGLNDATIAQQVIAAGAQDYLVKDDLTIQRLLQAMRFALERQAQVTQLKHQTAALSLALATERAANTSTAKFAAMVSHELRNALGVIQISTETLLEQPTQQVSHWLQRILRATHQLLLLTSDLVAFTRSQDAHESESFTGLDLAQFCTDLLDSIQQTTGRGHRMKLLMAGDLSLIQSDQYRLNCILTNLLTNAVKYSPNGSSIDFTVVADRKSVKFEIRDQGIGIPVIDQTQVLEAFYRGNNVGTIAGTGLGLAIVARCVETLQGQMTIYSTVDVGTTITVTLPIMS
jgi:signal transduction histidine kinase